VARFEKKGYSDDNEDDREYIVERMQRVSSAALTMEGIELTKHHRCKPQARHRPILLAI
jgi:hypothetical protein